MRLFNSLTAILLITGLVLAELTLLAAYPVRADSGASAGITKDYWRSWNMRGHDPRRTGRSPVRGARETRRVWEYLADGGYAINMEPTVNRDGVFFGTRGGLRRAGRNKESWDKSDGKIIGLNRGTGRPLWSPVSPGLAPYAYPHKKRPVTDQDAHAGAGLHLSWLNGTVEGTGAVDPLTGVIYFGRGDGKLYALDPKTGKVVWKFSTADPARPADPEGGGEIVGGPLVTEDGTIVFGTFAAPPKKRPPARIRHETSALYAVSREGELLWRYPAKGGLSNAISAPPALSPDGSRVYAVTALLDEKEDCDLIAVERSTGKLLWDRKLKRLGGQDLAVGTDGTIFIAGMGLRAVFGSLWLPVAMAFADRGDHSEMLWGPVHTDGDQPRSHMAGGVSLLEREGGRGESARVQDVFISTTIIRSSNGPGGMLHRLDPETGRVTASWDPVSAVPPCTGGLTDIAIDADGMLFVGVRGQREGFKAKATSGRVYCLAFVGDSFDVVWSFQVDNQIDWASPAIGPEGGIYFGSADVFDFGDSLASFINPPQSGKDMKNVDPVFYGVLPDNR